MVALGQSSYFFQNKEIKPGTKAHFSVPVTTGKDSTIIPVTVFNGARDGKTLGITAGVHGFEYSPIMAGQLLINSIVPQKLKGVIILVQVSNLESFLGRSPYVSPVDRKNLNRIFPGNPNGTNTEKVAHFITEQIIARSDYFLDMHSGDAPEDLMSYSAYYSNSALPEVSARGKAMAVALGFDYMVVFDTDGKAYMRKDKPSLYCTAEAFKRGIPSVDIECGRLGLRDQQAINQIASGVMNLLNHLDFQPLSKQVAANSSPVIFTKRIYTSSKFDGIFYPEKKAGDHVKKGMKLGHVTNYFGEIVQTIHAEADGRLLLIISTPPVNKGEDLAVIALEN